MSTYRATVISFIGYFFGVAEEVVSGFCFFVGVGVTAGVCVGTGVVDGCIVMVGVCVGTSVVGSFVDTG